MGTVGEDEKGGHNGIGGVGKGRGGLGEKGLQICRDRGKTKENNVK